MDDPFGIVPAVFHARHESVTQEIVHTVRIELAGNDIPKKMDGKCTVNHGADLVRIDFVAPESPVHFRYVIGNNQCGPAFVAGGGAKSPFDGV